MLIKSGFRPLAGIMVFIITLSAMMRRSLTAKFPSPCGDYGFYRLSSPLPLLLRRSSFRPLAGIMVFIRTLYKWLYEAVEMAFCGADHIFSSFFVFCKKMIFKKLLKTEF